MEKLWFLLMIGYPVVAVLGILIGMGWGTQLAKQMLRDAIEEGEAALDKIQSPIGTTVDKRA